VSDLDSDIDIPLKYQEVKIKLLITQEPHWPLPQPVASSLQGICVRQGALPVHIS
jgi:hypothetical protein